MKLNELLPILAIIISAGGFFFTYFQFVIKIQEKFGELMGRVIKVETQTELFWCIVEKNIADIVKHPYAFRKDELLDKLADHYLNKEEETELLIILKDIIKNTTDKTEKLVYALLIARLEILTEKK